MLTGTIPSQWTKGSAAGGIGSLGHHTYANICHKGTDLEILLRETASWKLKSTLPWRQGGTGALAAVRKPAR